MNEEVKPLIDKLKNRVPAPPLVPKKIWDSELSKSIEDLKVSNTLKATLHLWNDDLDKAHRLAQNIDNATGSLIHGIMHRREPDYSNSKYWFRHVKNHPIFLNLIQEFSGWEPFSFIDQCEKAASSKDDQISKDLEIVQSREIELLTHYCLELNS